MPVYKLYYFNARGGAEPIRFIFAQAGVPYEDVRVGYGAKDWEELKPNTPFGVVPMLEEDGEKIGGSLMIGRYIGEKYGLGGDSALENAQIASIADASRDIGQEVGKLFQEKDEAKKAQTKKRLKEEVFPNKLDFFEKHAATNENGWMSGKLSWADFFHYWALDLVLMMVDPEALSKFPNLKKFRASVEALPNIAKWIKERPKTDY